MKHQEHIVAVRAFAFEGFREGITRMGLLDFCKAFSGDVVIARRADLEKDPSFRQIIPYFMLIDRQNGNVILPYSRGNKGGESRLADNVSIGFGGHVDLIDLRCDENSMVDLLSTIMSAVYRELSEEVDLPQPEGSDKDRILGLFDVGVLIDNSNEVGKVHAGVVIAINIDTSLPFGVKEEGTAILVPGTPRQILDAGYNLESWSKIVLEHLATPFPVLNEEKLAAEAAHAELAE